MAKRDLLRLPDDFGEALGDLLKVKPPQKKAAKKPDRKKRKAKAPRRIT